MGLMDITVNDAVKLIRDGESIIETSTEFEKEIANIYTTIDDLKNSWTGESATRYTQEIEKYKSDFESLAKTLKQHGALAKAAGTDYNELENSI